MFRPIYTITPGIRDLISGINRDAWLVDRMLIMPKHEVWIRREINVSRASSTTRIEGAEMDETAVGNLLRHGPAAPPTSDERDNLNAIKAYEFIDYLSDQADLPINELAVREMNRQFIFAAGETLTPGAYRRGQNMAGDHYRPPDQGDVPALMAQLAGWLASEDGDLDPILRAGIAHLEFVAIHPFWDGNGRTARGLTALIIQRSEYHFRKLLSFEQYMASDTRRYFAAIDAALGREYTSGYDATPWLEYFVGAIWAQSQRLTELLTEWHRMMEDLHRQLGGRLHQRQVEALAYAHRIGNITRADYIDIAGVSPETASRDLARMLEEGVLTGRGNTRARVYTPVAIEHLAAAT